VSDFDTYVGFRCSKKVEKHRSKVLRVNVVGFCISGLVLTVASLKFFFTLQASHCKFTYLIIVFRLVTSSFEELLAFQRALKEFVGSADPVYSKQYEEFFIALEGRQVL